MTLEQPSCPWSSIRIILAGVMAFCLALPTAAAQDLQAEEAEDYYRKWLEQDVVYIITAQEKEVFRQLSTPEEKEQFIEQFWFRRDPDPMTVENEFKEEHYRRIAYANEIFQSGWPGWMTDRGRIYIIHGPPVEIESHASGDRYDRPLQEGGGTTSTYAYEVWRYRHIDGIGTDVLVEFVDDSFTGEYRLALTGKEKDALLHVAEQGLTLTEQLGGSRDDAAFFPDGDPMGITPEKESAFRRYETYTLLQRPEALKYKDLKRFVSVDVSYQKLPLKVRADYFKINEQSSLVPITLEVDNKSLSFVEQNGVKVGGIALYGSVTSLSNRVVGEFEHDLMTSLSGEDFQRGLWGRSLYQKNLLLESNGRYKLSLIVKDMNGANVGVLQQALVPRSAEPEKLSLSSVILSSAAKTLEVIPTEDQMFVIGDVWIVPSLDRTFKRGSQLVLYFQVYGATLDQTSQNPAVTVSVRVSDGNGNPVISEEETDGKSLVTVTSQRLVFVREFSLEQLEPGHYSIKLTVRDQITDTSVSARENFQVTG